MNSPLPSLLLGPASCWLCATLAPLCPYSEQGKRNLVKIFDSAHFSVEGKNSTERAVEQDS